MLQKQEIFSIENYSVADPFIVEKNGDIFLFYEIFSKSLKGQIWCAKLDQTLKVIESRRILKNEKGHISYPQIIECGDNIYMTIESIYSSELHIYKKVNWPYDWKLVNSIKFKYKISDPNLYHHDGKWVILFTITIGKILDSNSVLLAGELDLDLETSSEIIVKSIVKVNASSARNAGKIINIEGELYRPFQGLDQGFYGSNRGISKIIDARAASYDEIICDSPPFSELFMTNSHHLSLSENLICWDILN